MTNIKQPIISNWIAGVTVAITVIAYGTYLSFQAGKTLETVNRIEGTVRQMSGRLEKVESDINDLKVGVGQLSVKFDYLEKRVSNLEEKPSKPDRK